jgi:hypothetical protein
LTEGWAGLPDVAIQLFFLASQMFWLRRIGALGKQLVTGRRWRVALGASGLLIYSVLLAYNIRNWENVSQGSTLSLRAALLEAPMRLWLFGSLLGFLLIAALWIVVRVFKAIRWGLDKGGVAHAPEPLSPGRRRFLEQAAVGVAAAPFFAGTYGLFYGRLNLQITHQRTPCLACPRHLMGSASSSCPISTSAPSCPRTRSGGTPRSPMT